MNIPNCIITGLKSKWRVDLFQGRSLYFNSVRVLAEYIQSRTKTALRPRYLYEILGKSRPQIRELLDEIGVSRIYNIKTGQYIE